MNQDRLGKLVRQHARTSSLLGVDFVPSFRNAGTESLADAPPSAATTTAREAAPRLDRPASIRPGADPDPPHVVVVQTTCPRPRRDAARVQSMLDDLRRRYEADAPHQHFVTAHTNIVFGEGDPCARLMFVGEAPGADEDRTGRPFVGRAGQLLNKMIVAMGLAREEVYIGNVLKTRPPDNATPTSDEIKLCAPYLFEQIAIVDPEVIVTLGLPATRALLDTVDSMSRLRGRWASFPAPAPAGRAIPVMPTYHPAFLLRSYTTENRSKVWSDLKMVMDRLGLVSKGTSPA
jgi:uracil-DNA glycosylase